MLHQEETVNKRQMIVTIFNQYTDEVESLLASNILTILNEQFPDTISKQPESIFSLLNSSLDSVAIAAGSPKLRTSFGLLLKDQKMIKQKEWVQKQLDLRNLRDKEKDIFEKRKDLVTEDAQLSNVLEKLVLNQDKWTSSLGLEEYKRRMESVLQREKELDAIILSYSVKLKQVRDEITTKTQQPT